jgi:hypothetical protein
MIFPIPSTVGRERGGDDMLDDERIGILRSSNRKKEEGCGWARQRDLGSSGLFVVG